MPEPQTIITRLNRRVTTRKSLAIAGILAGLPFCFVAAVMLGSIFWFSFGLMFNVGYPWHIWVLGTALITIPLLFHTEIKTKGDFLGGVMRDIDTDFRTSSPATSAVATMPAAFLGLLAYHAAANPRASTAGFVEFFITGPRWVLNGLRHLRLVGKIPNVDMQQTANLIQRLLASDSGFTMDELSSTCESRDQLQETLIWLAFYGWIGVSTKKDRVYIYTESRRFLQS
jgi:hypothetical protein